MSSHYVGIHGVKRVEMSSIRPIHNPHGTSFVAVLTVTDWDGGVTRIELYAQNYAELMLNTEQPRRETWKAANG